MVTVLGVPSEWRREVKEVETEAGELGVGMLGMIV